MPKAPDSRFLNSLATRVHVFVYRLTGGLLGGTLAGAPILLLTTTGRRSGRHRTVPLVYVPDGGALIVIGSNAGGARQPGWYHNLHARHDAEVRVRRERINVRARDVASEQRARLWPVITERFPAYLDYQRRTSRRIPLVALERQDEPSRAAR